MWVGPNAKEKQKKDDYQLQKPSSIDPFFNSINLIFNIL